MGRNRKPATALTRSLSAAGTRRPATAPALPTVRAAGAAQGPGPAKQPLPDVLVEKAQRQQWEQVADPADRFGEP